jgi:hypothetical protein
LRQLAREDKSRHFGWLVKLAAYWAVLAAASAAFLIAAFALIPAWKASAPTVSAVSAPGIDLVKEAADPAKRGPFLDSPSLWLEGLVLAPLRAQLRPDPNFYFRQRVNERAPDWLALAQSKSAQRPIDIKAAQVPFVVVPPPAPVEAVKSVVAVVKRPATPVAPPSFEPPRFEPPRVETPPPEPVPVRPNPTTATFGEPPAQERPSLRSSGPSERPVTPVEAVDPSGLLAQAEQDYRAFPSVAAELTRKLPNLPSAERHSAELKLAEARARYAAALAERATLKAADRVTPAHLSGAERQAFEACLAANPAVEMTRLVRKPTLSFSQIPAYFVQVRTAQKDGAAGLESCLGSAGITGSFTLIVGSP